MDTHGFILAIDGPAGAGKSTIAEQVADRLGFAFINTGSLYRLVAWLDGQTGAIPSPEALDTLDVRFEGGRVWLQDRDVTADLQSQAIAEAASRISSLPEVRKGLLGVQRRLGRNHPRGAVLEGRDIGTVVFPDADLKIFLTASDEERARRRTEDLERTGTPEQFDHVLASIKSRDQRDRERASAPLKTADDAVTIDTTHLCTEEVLEQITQLARARMKFSK